MTDEPPPALLVVAAALVRTDAMTLVQQRPAGSALAGLWEFPGGKVEPGETPVAALVRELAEELGIVVAPEDAAPLAFAPGDAGGRPLVILLYIVRRWRGEPVAHAAAALRWATPAAMADLPMPPADVPLVAALADRLTGPG